MAYGLVRVEVGCVISVIFMVGIGIGARERGERGPGGGGGGNLVLATCKLTFLWWRLLFFMKVPKMLYITCMRHVRRQVHVCMNQQAVARSC